MQVQADEYLASKQKLSALQTTISQLEQLNQQYQTDQNWFNQYIAFVGERIHGNLGLSLTSQQPIFDELLWVWISVFLGSQVFLGCVLHVFLRQAM